ncbi:MULTISPECIES: ATP-binding protein [Bacillus]|uniref:ATP-binding protein n=1 Tax=Bacillus TaxID=1386 RepID=UPI001D0D6CC3|nr:MULTISPECIES: ATP-binding protein [Bacillus]
MRERMHIITPLVFLLVGSLWLIATDYFLYMLAQTQLVEMVNFLDFIKGWVFVGGAAILLFFMMKKQNAFNDMQEREQELSTLINSMPDFVCFKDGEGRWIRANDYGLSLYELDKVDYVGKKDNELATYTPYFKEAFEYCAKTDEQTWRSKKLTRSEESFLLPSGERKSFDVIKVPLYHKNGDRKALVAIGRDISVLKEAEQMMLKKEKLSVVGELSAGIAHEIRNPLTAIRGFIQLLDETDKPNKEHVKLVLSEVDRINQIVSEMLVLSKPQSREMKYFNFKKALHYCLNIVSYEASLYNIVVKVAEPEVEPIVYGDENGIKQALINIMKNAMEAMSDSGELHIHYSIVDEMLVVNIRDTGIGIPKEMIKRLGEPFLTSKEKGMGLGLNVTKKIIESHEGELHFESEEGKGTHVTLKLKVDLD